MENKDTIDDENKGQDSPVPSSKEKDARERNFVEQKVDNFTAPVDKLKKQYDAVMNNPNISVASKMAAVGLSAVEAGMAVNNAVKAIKGLATELADKALVAVLGKLTFLRGIACLPIVKQMDPVLGLDIHFVIIPPAPAVPMPHVYVGIMFEPKDFVSCSLLSIAAFFVPPPVPPVTSESDNGTVAAANAVKAYTLARQLIIGKLKNMGASVKIGPFIPRVVASTASKPVPHIPMGTGFSPAFIMVRKTCGYSFLGSLFVNADGFPLTGGFAHLHNDCWDMGKPPVEKMLAEAFARMFRMPPSPPPPKPPMLELYLPTGVMMPIPWNRPILVNPVPTPMNPTQVANIFLKAGFAKFMSKTGLDKKVDAVKAKAREKGEALINKMEKTALGKKLGCNFWTKASEKYGTCTSHPVDVSEGHFFTRSTDFAVSGVVPLKFSRVYHSYSDFDGALGKGWNHSYDMALATDSDAGMAGLRLEDGRTAAFELPAVGKSSFNRGEKLWLHRHEEGYFYLTDTEGHVYRFTDAEYRNPFNKSETYLLQSISNRNGYSVRMEYDRDGILKKITDAARRIFTVENDGRGHISRITAPSPDSPDENFVVSSYEYDAHGRLVSQTDALGATMRFEYDGSLMTKETWRNGTEWNIRYDKRGTGAKCLEISGPQDLFHHRLGYVASDCTVVTDSLGHKTTYYHRSGVVTKRIDPDGAETVFRYNQFNELEWTGDPLSNVSSASYDELGNLVNKTAADGGFLQLQYENPDFPCLPTSATDKAGGRWEWEYDESGNLVKRTNPLGAQTQFEYSDGLLTVITGALGQKTRLQYDERYNLVDAWSPDNGRSRWQHDLLGRCTRYENAKNGVTEYEYNALGNVVKVKLPDGNVRQLAYDQQGNVVHAKDNDRDVRFTYRGVNKLATRMERGATLRFGYDTEDQLRFVENENGEQYEFRLDAQGNVVEEIGFDGLRREYRRDLAGRVTSVHRPSGKEISYEYDEAGRVTKVRHEDGTEESYEYRKDGLLLKAVNEHAEVVLERDVLGRVVKEICNGETVESKYDIADNRIKITSSLGADLEAGYNLMGDVVSLATEGWQTGYERDVFGLETARRMDGGLLSHTERDSRGRVTEQKIERNNRYLSEKSYLWGLNDKLLSSVIDGKETRYEYDGWGNLSKTLFEDGKVEYRNPDRSGNLFESLDRMDRKYAKGGQLVKTENWEYKYDREGNLVRKKDKHGATWRYEWNAAGMLECVKRPDAQEVTFKYDALGRRIEKRFGRRVTTWQWDGNVPLHEKTETITPDYSEERGHFDDIRTQPVVTWVFEEGTFVPAAKITEKEKLSIVTNYLGTPEAMYREDGEKVWTCELNSYGKVRNFQGESKTGCPFRYQGQYEDSETGLYYNRFRYYSPEEGMYISQDPIGLRGGRALYSYVNDINRYVDIFGLVKKNNGKPRYAPAEDKWTGEKGGTIDKSRGDGNWTYTDSSGNTVPYVNGYPDFRNGTDKDGNKTFVKQEVPIKNMVGDHNKDYAAADAKANPPKRDDTTWHHHEDGETMQEVDADIHHVFTHEGGCSAVKKK